MKRSNSGTVAAAAAAISAVIALLLLADSCQKGGAAGTAGGPVPSDEPIVISSPTFHVDTKASGALTMSSIRAQGFGVTAFWRDGGVVFDGADVAHNYMQNVRPAYKGVIGGKESWSFEPAVYWPLGGGLSFFAYAPYMADDSENHQIQANANGSFPGGVFRQKSSPSEMIDFCIANPVYDHKAKDGSIDMVFSHALTNVQFYLNIKGAVYPGEDYKYRIKAMTISGVAGENTYFYGNGTRSFRWGELPRQDLSRRNASYTLTRAEGQLTEELLPHEKDLGAGVTGFDRYVRVNGPEAGVLYLLPQPVASSVKVSFTLTACTVSGEVVTEVKDLDPIEVWLPETTVWESGKQVAYLISLDTTTWVETLFRVDITQWGGATYSANVFENAVYVSRNGSVCSVAKVGNGFTAGDLSVNPPVLYVNEVEKGVSAWSHLGSELKAATGDGTYRFSLSDDGTPVTVEIQ